MNPQPRPNQFQSKFATRSQTRLERIGKKEVRCVLFPRLIERGSIEAKSLMDLSRQNSETFPRLIERGSIEAQAQAVVKIMAGQEVSTLD